MKHLLLALTIGSIQVWSIACLSISTPTADPSPTSARVFVGGLSPLTQAHDLENKFQQFGPVTEVSIHNLKWGTPYAFVNFESAEAAGRAVEFKFKDHDDETSFQVQPARPMVTRAKSQQRRDKSELDWEDKLRIAQTSNVILQVHRSHLDRLEDFMGQQRDTEVVGAVADSGSKTVGLLGLRVTDTAKFVQTLQNLPFNAVAMNKVYLVEDTNIVITDDDADPTTQLLNSAQVKQFPRGSIMRLHTFPPNLTSPILKAFEEQQDEIQVAPTGHTHVLNVVQLRSTDGKQMVWMSGISERSLSWSRMQHRIGPESTYVPNEADDDICRAYYKLQEAFCRYTGDSVFESKSASNIDGLVALDCGASPGGWTKYLCEQGDDIVKRVYSVDPGVLDATVESLPPVQHLALKLEDALPSILNDNDNDVHIDVWVSDMCLHQMGEQIDYLLTARDMGLVGPGTFFVLTLKCLVGRSKESFDRQVARECQRLDGMTRDMQVFHLFANRSGERTVMGYLT
jgi:RNA recognition motif-containing protein